MAFFFINLNHIQFFDLTKWSLKLHVFRILQLIRFIMNFTPMVDYTVSVGSLFCCRLFGPSLVLRYSKWNCCCTADWKTCSNSIQEKLRVFHLLFMSLDNTIKWFGCYWRPCNHFYFWGIFTNKFPRSTQYFKDYDRTKKKNKNFQKHLYPLLEC